MANHISILALIILSKQGSVFVAALWVVAILHVMQINQLPQLSVRT